MNRSDYVLGVMAAAQRSLSPVQVQKLFFLLDQKAAPLVGGPHFDFQPYNYGPFDPAVYHELEGLTRRGLVVVENTSNTRRYGISTGGIFSGLSAFGQLPANAQAYIRQVAEWVTSQSFAQLVAAVYAEWPEMRAKSIFRG